MPPSITFQQLRAKHPVGLAPVVPPAVLKHFATPALRYICVTGHVTDAGVKDKVVTILPSHIVVAGPGGTVTKSAAITDIVDISRQADRKTATKETVVIRHRAKDKGEAVVKPRAIVLEFNSGDSASFDDMLAVIAALGNPQTKVMVRSAHDPPIATSIGQVNPSAVARLARSVSGGRRKHAATVETAREVLKQSPRPTRIEFDAGNDVTVNKYRQRVHRIYGKYCPERLQRAGAIEEALVTFKGDEETLIRALVKKYGPEPTPPPSPTASGGHNDEEVNRGLSPAPSDDSARGGGGGGAREDDAVAHRSRAMSAAIMDWNAGVAAADPATDVGAAIPLVLSGEYTSESGHAPVDSRRPDEEQADRNGIHASDVQSPEIRGGAATKQTSPTMAPQAGAGVVVASPSAAAAAPMTSGTGHVGGDLQAPAADGGTATGGGLTIAGEGQQRPRSPSAAAAVAPPARRSPSPPAKPHDARDRRRSPSSLQTTESLPPRATAWRPRDVLSPSSGGGGGGRRGDNPYTKGEDDDDDLSPGDRDTIQQSMERFEAMSSSAQRERDPRARSSGSIRVQRKKPGASSSGDQSASPQHTADEIDRVLQDLTQLREEIVEMKRNASSAARDDGSPAATRNPRHLHQRRRSASVESFDTDRDEPRSAAAAAAGSHHHHSPATGRAHGTPSRLDVAAALDAVRTGFTAASRALDGPSSSFTSPQENAAFIEAFRRLDGPLRSLYMAVQPLAATKGGTRGATGVDSDFVDSDFEDYSPRPRRSPTTSPPPTASHRDTTAGQPSARSNRANKSTCLPAAWVTVDLGEMNLNVHPPTTKRYHRLLAEKPTVDSHLAASQVAARFRVTDTDLVIATRSQLATGFGGWAIRGADVLLVCPGVVRRLPQFGRVVPSATGREFAEGTNPLLAGASLSEQGGYSPVRPENAHAFRQADDNLSVTIATREHVVVLEFETRPVRDRWLNRLLAIRARNMENPGWFPGRAHSSPGGAGSPHDATGDMSQLSPIHRTTAASGLYPGAGDVASPPRAAHRGAAAARRLSIDDIEAPTAAQTVGAGSISRRPGPSPGRSVASSPSSRRSATSATASSRLQREPSEAGPSFDALVRELYAGEGGTMAASSPPMTSGRGAPNPSSDLSKKVSPSMPVVSTAFAIPDATAAAPAASTTGAHDDAKEPDEKRPEVIVEQPPLSAPGQSSQRPPSAGGAATAGGQLPGVSVPPTPTGVHNYHLDGAADNGRASRGSASGRNSVAAYTPLPPNLRAEL